MQKSHSCVTCKSMRRQCYWPHGWAHASVDVPPAVVTARDQIGSHALHKRIVPSRRRKRVDHGPRTTAIWSHTPHRPCARGFAIVEVWKGDDACPVRHTSYRPCVRAVVQV
eukprot:337297-Chlamydomonas_euryale.AAC.1